MYYKVKENQGFIRKRLNLVTLACLSLLADQGRYWSQGVTIVEASLTKDRRGSTWEGETPRASASGGIAFQPGRAARLSFCDGRRKARCPSRGADVTVCREWRAITNRSGCGHRGG